MLDPPIIKEALLSKRRRSEAAQLQVVNIDSYQKQRRQINLIPKSLNQESYIDLLENPQRLIVYATGPAGTGKTMLAVLAALKAFRAGNCSKIVITRPAVGVDDEQHGFLPGTLNQKMEPWTRPIFDVLHEHYSVRETARMLEEQILEISPLAFMRGRTFKNAWIIADEIYGRFVYDGSDRAPSFHDIMDDKDQIMFVQTLSKNWAMTGWRIGYVRSAPEIIAQARKVHDFLSIGAAAPPVQWSKLLVTKVEPFQYSVVIGTGMVINCEPLAFCSRRRP